MSRRAPGLEASLRRIDGWFEAHHPDRLAALAGDLPTLPADHESFFGGHRVLEMEGTLDEHGNVRADRGPG